MKNFVKDLKALTGLPCGIIDWHPSADWQYMASDAFIQQAAASFSRKTPDHGQERIQKNMASVINSIKFNIRNTQEDEVRRTLGRMAPDFLKILENNNVQSLSSLQEALSTWDIAKNPVCAQLICGHDSEKPVALIAFIDARRFDPPLKLVESLLPIPPEKIPGTSNDWLRYMILREAAACLTASNKQAESLAVKKFCEERISPDISKALRLAQTIQQFHAPLPDRRAAEIGVIFPGEQGKSLDKISDIMRAISMIRKNILEHVRVNAVSDERRIAQLLRPDTREILEHFGEVITKSGKEDLLLSDKNIHEFINFLQDKEGIMPESTRDILIKICDSVEFNKLTPGTLHKTLEAMHKKGRFIDDPTAQHIAALYADGLKLFFPSLISPHRGAIPILALSDPLSKRPQAANR